MQLMEVSGRPIKHVAEAEFRYSFRGIFLAFLVEVAGIEPASFGTKTGLLRAYFANRLLDPGYHTNK